MMVTRLCHSRVVHWVNIAFINASLFSKELDVSKNLLVIKLTKSQLLIKQISLQSNTSNFTNNKKHDELGKTVR